MLGSSITIFVIETILAIVIPITAPLSSNKVGLICCLVSSIACTIGAIIGVVRSSRNIKDAYERGKNITALVFSIINIVSGAVLCILCIVFMAAIRTYIA
ncbi:MAG: hypothetical protein MJ213_00760 [Bacilli bacterium]|nr:hypothetical protein [Bacilli bacterium]